jgi:hypothetical protein
MGHNRLARPIRLGLPLLFCKRCHDAGYLGLPLGPGAAVLGFFPKHGFDLVIRHTQPL